MRNIKWFHIATVGEQIIRNVPAEISHFPTHKPVSGNHSSHPTHCEQQTIQRTPVFGENFNKYRIISKVGIQYEHKASKNDDEVSLATPLVTTRRKSSFASRNLWIWCGCTQSWRRETWNALENGQCISGWWLRLSTLSAISLINEYWKTYILVIEIRAVNIE